VVEAGRPAIVDNRALHEEDREVRSGDHEHDDGANEEHNLFLAPIEYENAATEQDKVDAYVTLAGLDG
jgi:hypothetical protein